MFGIKESHIVVENGAAELINTVTTALSGRFGLVDQLSRNTHQDLKI